jgi:lysophospholipase L1-like esterase
VVGESVAITLATEDRPGTVEVYWGPFYEATHPIGPQPTTLTLSLPERHEFHNRIVSTMTPTFDPALLRVVLPRAPRITLHAIEGDIAPPRRDQTPSQVMMIYGSSITQGADGVRPSGTYPMRAAQRLGVDLLNLGFSGGALCEGAIADYIAGRTDWDFAVLELGRNAYFRMSPAEFKSRANYLIEKITLAHPDQWIFCIDIFTGVEDYGNPNQDAMNEARQTVKDAVARLNMPRLVPIDGRDIIPDATGLTTDLVHPSPIGMEEMALNLVRFIREKMPNGYRS